MQNKFLIKYSAALVILSLPLSACGHEQTLCPEQVSKDYKDIFLECLSRTHINALSGDKYQGWDEVVNECHKAARQVSGVERNGYYQCYIAVKGD